MIAVRYTKEVKRGTEQAVLATEKKQQPRVLRWVVFMHAAMQFARRVLVLLGPISETTPRKSTTQTPLTLLKYCLYLGVVYQYTKPETKTCVYNREEEERSAKHEQLQ